MDKFPVKNGYSMIKSGQIDAFLIKIDTLKYNEESLIYGTYIGGKVTEGLIVKYPPRQRGTGVEVDSDENAYVTGDTNATDFPVKGAFQPNLKGERNAFLTKVNTKEVGKPSLVYGTYIGGSGYDNGGGIALDDNRNAYITGTTPSQNFPTKNAIQSTLQGMSDAFLAKIDTTRSGPLGFMYGTYLGGKDYNVGRDVAVDNRENAYLTGTTYSKYFPVKSAYQPTLNGSSDIYLSVIDTVSSTLAYSTYLGGSSQDEGYGVATDNKGNVYVTGYTYSNNFPYKKGYSKQLKGDIDAILSKFSIGIPRAQIDIFKSANKRFVNPGEIIKYSFTLKNIGEVSAYSVIFEDNLPMGVELYGAITVSGASGGNPEYNYGDSTFIELDLGPIDIGKEIKVEFNVRVKSILINPISNEATAIYRFLIFEARSTSNRVNTYTLPVIWDKNVDKVYADIGEELTYSITATNVGDTNAENVVLIDEIPVGTTFIASSLIVDGIVDPSGNPSKGVNLGTIVPNQTKIIIFKVKVESVNDGAIKNQGNGNYYYIVDSTQPPKYITDSTNVVTTTIKHGEILPENAVKLADKANVTSGEIIQYTINAKNTGNVEINNVTIKDTIHIGTNFIEGSITIDGVHVVYPDPILGIDVGRLYPSESVSVTFKVRVNEDASNTLTNTATIEYSYIVDSTQPPKTEIVETNSVIIQKLNPELTLSKSIDKKYVIVGDIVTYTVVAKNTGDIVIGNVGLDPVTLYDILSPSLEFVAGTVTINGVVDPLSGIVEGIDIGILNVGQSVTITFKAKVISNEIYPIENTSKATFGFQLPGEKPEVGESTSNVVQVFPDLAKIDVVKSADKDFIVLGDTIIYTVKLTNSGTIDAQNVIFKDTLPSNVELVNGTFKINGTVVNGVDLEAGANIGIILKGTTKAIEYTIKVVDPNCSFQIINLAWVEFSYTLLDESTGTTESNRGETSTVIVNLGIANFKQMSIEESLPIPAHKPDVESINSISGTIEGVRCHIIETGKLISHEGQNLSGYKLIIHGILREILEYTACDAEQSVHSAHYDIPFSTFVVLPKNYSVGSKIEVEGIVEDIYNKLLDCRYFFTNATVLINVKIVHC